jgi:uncharacterized protein (DUF4415 family)
MKSKAKEQTERDFERELAGLASKREEDIDLTDMPEVRDWSKAQRGRFYRPVKEQLTLRLDSDLVQWFKDQAPRGYQTRINEALRRFVEAHKRDAA